MLSFTGRLGVMSLGLLVLGLGGAANAAAHSAPRLSASLDSRPIDPRTAGHYHCHDFAYPQLRCFRNRSALERAVTATMRHSTVTDSRAPSMRLGLNYVRVFQHVSYAGASAYLSVNYSDLRTIGWNDTISSYYVVNSGSGRFYQNIGYGGIGTDFCCNQGVTNVGGSLNDTFSAVEGSA